MIKVRAHHLLCIPRFYGGGYNKVFGKNLKKVCFYIRKHPNTKIKVVKKCDDICSKCLHKKNDLCKQTPKINYWILSQDNKVLKRLEVKENFVFKAKEVFNLSMDKVGNKDVKTICNGCPFLDNCLKVGVNNSFRRELNK